MIIDTHVHLGGYPSYQNLGDKIRTMEDAIAFRSRYPELYHARITEDPIDISDQLIQTMDAHQVDIALIIATPGRVTNEQVAQWVKRHPGRLFGLVRVGQELEATGFWGDPAPYREQAIREIQNGIENLGMVGFGEIVPRALTRETHPEKIADDLAPIMEALAKYKVPIQIPTAWTQFPGALYYGDPIWVDEIAGKHPDVPIILTKMGRSITHLFENALSVAMRNENVYFDTVGTRPDHLKRAVKAIGSHRIMFGSDWSATWRWLSEPQDIYSVRKKVLLDAELTEADHEQILWKTAAKVFQLPV